jgi:aspartokinase/homoserine dehydrogenase 1
MNARDVLTVSPTRLCEVMWAVSREQLDDWKIEHDPVPATIIITGFVASTPNGVATTLGRNGSDFSASISPRSSMPRRSTSGRMSTA